MSDGQSTQSAQSVMLTREAFDRKRQAAKQAQQRAGIPLVIASVGLGFAQLGFIRWADQHLSRGTRVKLEGGIFLAYMALVAVLLWRMMRRMSAARLRCPHCGVALKEMSERVAVATGRCDACGGQIIA